MGAAAADEDRRLAAPVLDHGNSLGFTAARSLIFRALRAGSQGGAPPSPRPFALPDCWPM